MVNKATVKQVVAKKTAYLLDVRTPDECDVGVIGHAMNIPFDEVPIAFNLDDETFETRYHSVKPKPTDPMIVYCSQGPRANEAARALEAMGYSQLAVYKGWSDWVRAY